MNLPPLRLCLLLALSVLTAGCLQVEHIVSLKPDGSGTLSVKMVMPKAFIEQMKQMAEAMGQPGEDGKPKPFDLLDENKLREDAAKLGEGVEYLGAEKVSADEGEGYVARYSFKDINKLTLDQNPGSAAPSPGGGGAPGAAPEMITFKFTPGRTAKLTIANPEVKMPDAREEKDEEDEKPAEGEDAETDAAAEQMATAMMQQMFKDMRVVVAIEFDGRIVETNASHVSGNRVTVMSLDFNKLLADPAKLKALGKAQPKSLEETKALLAGIDGILVETKPNVSVEFR